MLGCTEEEAGTESDTILRSDSSGLNRKLPNDSSALPLLLDETVPFWTGVGGFDKKTVVGKEPAADETGEADEIRLLGGSDAEEADEIRLLGGSLSSTSATEAVGACVGMRAAGPGAPPGV